MSKAEREPDAGTVYDRVLRPQGGCTLYHYCSSQAFLSVLESGSLRFSDANMMNDAGECRYGYALFERAANALLELAREKRELEGLDTSFLDMVDDYLSPKQLHSHPVIASFSKDPDVLSQWRSYAENAAGWAVGFDAASLTTMPITLLEVVYDPDQQLQEVRNFLAAMYVIWREDGGDFKSAVGKDAALLSSFLIAYKHPSFREEQEVRALHELRVELSDDGLLLVDEGGVADGHDVSGERVRFRAAGPSIIAYVDIPLPKLAEGAIRELWLGPRNENGPGNAIYPLTQFGHRNVALHHSTSSYRG